MFLYVDFVFGDSSIGEGFVDAHTSVMGKGCGYLVATGGLLIIIGFELPCPLPHMYSWWRGLLVLLITGALPITTVFTLRHRIS